MANPQPEQPKRPAAPAPANNVPGQDPRRKVVVVPSLAAGANSLNVVWALLAGLISVAAHALLIFVFMLLPAGNAAGNPTGEIKTETVVEDEVKEKEPDLTNTDIGLDSDVPTNFNVDRIEEVSVPGMVNPTEAVGIIGAPEGPAKTLPAPPGTGGGTGGAQFDPNQAGSGMMYGTLGGMGGIANLGGFAGRSGATREKMLQEGGGNALSEACVAKGLLWLACHQSSDGRWSLNEFNRVARDKPLPAGKVFVCNCNPQCNRRDDIAATSFALLPFLAAGITHRPSAKEKQAVQYNKSVMAGVNYLISKQGKDGYYGGGMYSHGLATIAMCEAFGLTSDPLLKKSAQLACNYIVAAQDPVGGGWRYSPRTPGDVSVTGWQLMALKSGQMAGLSIPVECLKKAENFLRSCETKQDSGAYCYVPGGGATPTMTAVALLCRMYLGVNPRNPGLLAGVDELKKNLPGTTNNLYYEYYATQVMHHFGGEAWDLWNKGADGKAGIRDTLIKKMDTGLSPKTNHQEGSWAATGAFATEGGRIMSTSLSLLCLEVYYRHLPLYRRDMGVMKNEK